MLWDVVYEFFVKYIFGGSLRLGNAYRVYSANMGVALFEEDVWFINTSDAVGLNLNLQSDGYLSTYYYSLGNYLSLIATIITMVAILLFCVFIIKKIIGIIFRLFTGSSAF